MAENEAMQTSGLYVDYRGERHPVLFAGEEWLAVPESVHDRETERFPDAIEHGENSRGAWVKLPKHVLDRRVEVRVDARWRGEPVTVAALAGDQVVVDWLGTSARAHELRLPGAQRDGWRFRVPVDEVEVTGVREREY